MRIWSVDSLRSDIGAGAFGQKDVFLYWMAWIFLGRFLYPIGARSVGAPGYMKILFFCASLLVSVLGAIACYRANGGRDGDRLMDRVTAFLVLMQIRGLIFVILPGAFLLAILARAFGFESDTSAFMNANPQFLLSLVIFYQIYIWRGVSRQLRLLRALD